MKIWIMSDLHLECFPFPEALRLKIPDFDILVCVGDVIEGKCKEGFKFLRSLAGAKPIVFVMGNHEYWYSTLPIEIEKAKKFAKEYQITLLENDEIDLLGCHFIGGTLWTDYTFSGPKLDHNAPTGEKVFTALGNDRPQPFLVNDSINLHQKTRQMIAKSVAKYDGGMPIVVVTHHAPLFECLPKNAIGTFWAGNCASDLSELTDMGKIKLWVHGHLHHSVDFKRPLGTRIICNPLGYHFENESFHENLVIDV